MKDDKIVERIIRPPGSNSMWPPGKGPHRYKTSGGKSLEQILEEMIDNPDAEWKVIDSNWKFNNRFTRGKKMTKARNDLQKVIRERMIRRREREDKASQKRLNQKIKAHAKDNP
jgi:hypothetical protein